MEGPVDRKDLIALARARFGLRRFRPALHSYFLAGKYPDRSESRRVMERLSRAACQATTRSGIAISELARLADVSEKRAKVIVAQLEGAELVKRTREKVRMVRGPRDDAELDQLLSAYEQRRGSDRERLDAVMHYAQSPRCRMQQLVAYFSGDAGQVCGRCDNCLLPHAGGRAPSAPPMGAARTDELDRLVASACGNVEVASVVG